MSDLRVSAAEAKSAQAQAQADNAVSAFLADLGANPFLMYDKVHRYEQARVCTLKGPNVHVQPGQQWPTVCGTTWVYAQATTAASARIRVQPPKIGSPDMLVTAVGEFEDTQVAVEVVLRRETAANWTVMTDEDLALVDVVVPGSGQSVTADDLTLYSRGEIDLTVPGGATFTDGIFAAEAGFVGNSPGNSNLLYEPDVETSSVSDLRKIEPTPLSTSQLKASAQKARDIACRADALPAKKLDPTTLLADNTLMGNADPLVQSHLCLRKGARLVPVWSADEFAIEGTYDMFWTAHHDHPTWGKLIHIYGLPNAESLAGFDKPTTNPVAETAGLMTAGVHPGDRDGPWTYLTAVGFPENGMIVSDVPMVISVCGPNFAGTTSGCWMNPGADVPGAHTIYDSLTYIVGSETNPADVWIAGSLSSVSPDASWGIVSFGDILIPYWSHLIGGPVRIDANMVALGDGAQSSDTASLNPIRLWPENLAAGTVEQAGPVTINGSIAARRVGFGDMNAAASIVVSPDHQGAIPPFFPGTDDTWTKVRTTKRPTTNVCTTSDCADFLGSGSAGSGPAPETAPPAAPAFLYGSSSESTKISVVWERVAGDPRYEVQYRPVGTTSFEAAAHVGTGCPVTTCSLLITGLIDGVDYEVQAVSIGSSGLRSAASEMAVISASGTAAPPLNLQASSTVGQAIALTWDPPLGQVPTGYEVYRDDVFQELVRGTTYLDADPDAGTTHSYQVRSVTPKGTSTPTQVDSVTVNQDFTLPSAPASVSVAAHSNGVQIVVTATAPVNDGGLPVLGYQAKCTAGSGAFNSWHSPGLIIPVDAPLNEEYTCEVSATNALGTGPVAVAAPLQM